MPEATLYKTLWVRSGEPGVVCLHSPVLDVTDTLTSAELNAVARAVEKRRKEYATGRWLAHRALSQLGLDMESILCGDQREPLWPESVVGSITHTDGHVAVALSASPDIVGVGIDLERTGRVGDSILRKILTERERSQLGDVDPTLIFSAKEACYKLLYPIFREYVEFQAVEIIVNKAEASFTMRYVGLRPDHALIEHAKGSFQQMEGCWLTLVVLAADTQPPG